MRFASVSDDTWYASISDHLAGSTSPAKGAITMMLHTNYANGYEILYAALKNAKRAGLLHSAITIAEGMSIHNSRSHATAISFSLEYVGDPDTASRTRRRKRNSGISGARTNSYAATWDEHGHFLAQVFALDPAAVLGSVTRPVYNGQADFHARTENKY